VHVPLTLNDHLARAIQAYGARTGLVDEPEQPAASLGSVTYADVGRLADAHAAARS
jgi:fatty-acyl-CoA synthase